MRMPNTNSHPRPRAPNQQINHIRRQTNELPRVHWESEGRSLPSQVAFHCLS